MTGYEEAITILKDTRFKNRILLLAAHIFSMTVAGGVVATEEEILKSRYIFITIAPFMIISIILPLILGVFGLLTPTLKFFDNTKFNGIIS